MKKRNSLVRQDSRKVARRVIRPTPGIWYPVGCMIEVESDDVADIAVFDPSAFEQENLGRPADEILANVWLCAAAPEMWRALRSCRKALRSILHSGGQAGPEVTAAAREALRAASRAIRNSEYRRHV